MHQGPTIYRKVYRSQYLLQMLTNGKKTVRQLIPAFTVTDLIDSTPVGLQVEIVTAYATGGDVIVKVTKRNQSKTPYARFRCNRKLGSFICFN